MQLDLRDLDLFTGVAEAGGFRRAATQLNVRQSVLSRRIRNLEESLGVSLFERHRAGVRLTHAGERLLRDARTIKDQVDATVRAVTAEGFASEGAICIGVIASLSADFLHELLRRWIAAHPKVDLHFVEGSPREHVGAVANRRMDVTFVTGSLASVGCDVEALWDEPFVVALPAEHALSGRADIGLAELRGERFVISRSSPGPEIYEFIVQRLNGLERPRIDAFNIGREALLSLVGLGVAITLASGSTAGVSYPGVRFVPIAGESLRFSAVWSPANDNPALRRFLSEARLLARERNGAPSRMLDRSP